MKPSVTVVILNWCGEDVTRRCIESLLESRYEQLRILLVDNGSPDGSGERLRRGFPGIDYLQTGSNLGYTGGNNRGIDRALANGAEYVLILNNDTVVEPEAISSLVAAHASAGDDVGAVAPKILRLGDPGRLWYGGGDFSMSRGLGVHRNEGELDSGHADDGLQDVTFVTGCCILFPAEVLRATGGFLGELFAYMEDVEISLRLTKAGYRLIYEPRARIFHDVPPIDAAPSPFQIRQRDANRRRVMRRHFTWPERLPFLLRFYATRTMLLARYLATRDRARARAVIDGAFGGWDD